MECSGRVSRRFPEWALRSKKITSTSKWKKSYLNEALSVLMLCALVFIFTSSSSALLGCPRARCGLLVAIFNTLFWVYANFFHEKTDKTQTYSKFAIFVCYENGRRRLLGAQSINTEELVFERMRAFEFSVSSVSGQSVKCWSNTPLSQWSLRFQWVRLSWAPISSGCWPSKALPWNQ